MITSPNQTISPKTYKIPQFEIEKTPPEKISIPKIKLPSINEIKIRIEDFVQPIIDPLKEGSDLRAHPYEFLSDAINERVTSVTDYLLPPIEIKQPQPHQPNTNSLGDSTSSSSEGLAYTDYRKLLSSDESSGESTFYSGEDLG